MGKKLYGHITIDARGAQCNLAADEDDFAEHFPACDVAGWVTVEAGDLVYNMLSSQQIDEWITSKALVAMGYLGE